jgi:hypothetical protein
MKHMHMYNTGQPFSSSFLISLFFVCIFVPMQKERMSEQDGRTDRRTNCSRTYTFVLLLVFISQMTRRKNKKNRGTCSIYISIYYNWPQINCTCKQEMAANSVMARTWHVGGGGERMT